MLELTTSTGKTFKIEDIKDTGDYIKITYVNKEKEKLIYFIRITSKDRLVMN